MPVSSEKLTCTQRVERECTVRGSRSRPAAPLWAPSLTAYAPGFSARRYFPFSSVVTCATCWPLCEKRSWTWRAGAVHGCSAAHIGVIGPRTTLPQTPVCSWPGVAAAAVATATTTAAIVTMSTRICRERTTGGRNETGPASPPAPCSIDCVLGSVADLELADPRRPVPERCPLARPVRRAAAGPEQVVARATGEERSSPVG